jgi:hypothetical protein
MVVRILPDFALGKLFTSGPGIGFAKSVDYLSPTNAHSPMAASSRLNPFAALTLKTGLLF